MKISTKGRYALRLMLDLAQHNTGEYISLKDISGRQDITVKYLEQIVTSLTRAGFLRSQRGNNGGYRLAKNPAEYKVGDILRAMEGSLDPVNCDASVEDIRNEDFAVLNNAITVEQLSRAMQLGKLGEQIVLKSRFAFSKIKYEGFEVAEKDMYYVLRKSRDDKANQTYLDILEEESDGLYIQDIIRGGVSNDDPRIPRNLSE